MPRTLYFLFPHADDVTTTACNIIGASPRAAACSRRLREQPLTANDVGSNDPLH